MKKVMFLKAFLISSATVAIALGNGCTKQMGFGLLTFEHENYSALGSNSSANFQSIRNEILIPKCLACHNSDLSSGGVSYSDYNSTLKTVVAGDPNASRLYLAPKSGTMPQSGAKLTPQELTNIETWILNGAKDDAPPIPPGNFPAFNPVLQPELKALTPREYDRSLQVMLGLNSNIGKLTLIQTVGAPFDNDVAEFIVSRTHIDSFEFAATKVADAFLASPTKASYIPCVAANATDRSCLEKFAVQLGSVAYRSLVSAAEMKKVVDAAVASATAQAQFDAGLRLVIQYVLQNPRFLYRFENGNIKEGLVELTHLEYLSKITFFLLGRPPTLAELQEVTNGAFASTATKDAFFAKLLNDPGLVDQMDHVHALWMGYSELGPQSTQAGFFRTETKALIAKVLNEGLPWSAILTSNQTYANDTLAKLYGIDDISTGWKWRTYKPNTRQGLLSHGSFLSVGVKFGDTSTTRRGYNIQKALFCGTIGRPPPVDENGAPINIDEPPPSQTVYECKEDLYRNTVLSRKNCAACHNMMDSIAFGLENYGPDAAYRTTEVGKTQCQIKGSGEVFVMSQTGLTKLGNFSGPKELADLALSSGYVERCLATRMSQFSMGRKTNYQDEGLIYNLYASQKKSSSFKQFLKDFISSPEFSIRKGL